MVAVPTWMSALRERTEGRTVSASSGADAGFAWIVIAGAVGLAWIATYVGGGSKTALPHAFYVPLIIGSIRFGARGALVVAVAAGLAAGPIMPLDVAAQTPQLPANWLTRLGIFVVLGQLTAYLSRHSLPSLTEDITTRRFRDEMRRATASGQLHVDYQPLVDLRTGDLVGVEALVRWNHPVRGVIPPDEFIPQAERTGCIGYVTRFVIGEACRQVATWRETVLAGDEPFLVAVNVSAADLHDDDLPGYIGEVLAATGVPNQWLHLEITETSLVLDIDTAVNGLMALRLLGIRLAVDDFGTGESSLGHLHLFPIDVLKLDRVFIDQLEHHVRGEVLVRGVVALARAMNLTVVAEGLETPTQAEIVARLGCHLGQGYLFSKPLRPEGVQAIIEDAARFKSTNAGRLTPGAGSRRA